MGLKYLALGDSYTIGEGVRDGERWPQLWAAALAKIGNDVEPPRILARTGWTTDELEGAMDAAEPLGEWDLVSLLIGVNDQYRGRTAEDYAARYVPLLERSIALAGDRPERVLALSIPDWGATPFAMASGRDRAGIAAHRANRSGSKAWVVATILFWPFSFIYPLAINREEVD